jgi:glucosyl-3-phosphoglycerate synthase
MADFYQTGTVATLHRLNPDGTARLTGELERLSDHVSMGLVLPALYSEFETTAMRRISRELRKVRYLKHIVVAVGRANYDQLLYARSFFADYDVKVTFIWIESDPVQRLFRLLDEAGVPAGEDGKGRSCWLSYGYLLATGDCDVIALHDCDIKNYSTDMVARLLYPVANPDLGFEFCKGFYARVTDRMHGRVTRLFMTPLVRSLQTLAPEAGFLRFLDSFRYPLAGEFAMKANLARVNRIPADWGLEVGVLAEVYRNCALSRTCQVDISDNYDHKHQILSADDASKGLSRMTYEIAKSLFRTMACEGIVLSRDSFHALEARYVRMAEDTIHRYYADAMLNGLQFDRHCEEQAVATFARSLRRAAESFQADPLGAPLIPNWNRVLAAVPDFFSQLLDAVAEYNDSVPGSSAALPAVASYVA